MPNKPQINLSPNDHTWYGWIPDIPDYRDFKYCVSPFVTKVLPTEVDLRGNDPFIFNQEALGSCVGNASAMAHIYNQRSMSVKNLLIPSRLFIYYNARLIEGTINVDCGCQIRNGIKVLAKVGSCSEEKWIYDISKFKKRPTLGCYWEARKHQVIEYKRLNQTLDQLKGCLAEGHPFIFGFTVFSYFQSNEVANSGTLNMPTQGEGRCGGHCVLAVGYKESEKRFIIQNSWGDDWGQKGFFTMPYDYILNSDLATDFWVIQTVEV